MTQRSLTVTQLKATCGRFPGATEKLYGPPSNFLMYAVGGRMFAYFKTSAPEKWRFSTRVAPDRFVELTDMPGVKPARYRGRYGWITLDASRAVAQRRSSMIRRVRPLPCA